MPQKRAHRPSGGEYRCRGTEHDEPIETLIGQRIKVDQESGCWLWTATTSSGYAVFRDVIVHRRVYEIMVGDIPDGHHVHHRCQVKHCVNPEHVVALSPAEHRALGRMATHILELVAALEPGEVGRVHQADVRGVALQRELHGPAGIQVTEVGFEVLHDRPSSGLACTPEEVCLDFEALTKKRLVPRNGLWMEAGTLRAGLCRWRSSDIVGSTFDFGGTQQRRRAFAMGQRPYNDPEYRSARDWLRAHPGTLCYFGCGRPATTIDHNPSLMHHNHRRGAGCCTLHPACARCNFADGARKGNRRRSHGYDWP